MKLPIIFRNFDVSLLWTSQVISAAGNRMFQIAVIWWLMSNMGFAEGTSVGLFLVASSLPAIIFANLIGKVVDNFPRKKILLISDGLGITLATILVILFHYQIMHFALILTAGFLFSLFAAFIEPSLQRSIPEICQGDDVDKSISFFTMTGTLAGMLGALAGAFLIENYGILVIAVLNGLTYVVSFFCDSLLSYRYKKDSNDKENQQQLISGYKILSSMPKIKKILLGFAAINFFLTPLMVLMPIYTKVVLSANASTLGILEALIGLGMISGSLLAPYLYLKDKVLLFISTSLLSVGICLAIPGIWVNVFLYGAILLFIGFSLGAMNVRIISFFHKVVKNEDKGRFFAILNAVVGLTLPVGLLLFGILSSLIPILHLSILQGAAVLTISTVFFFWTFGPMKEGLVTNSFNNQNSNEAHCEI